MPKNDVRTPFARLGIALVIGLTAAVLLALVGASGPGLFTEQQAIFGLGVAVLVVGVILLVLMRTIARVLEQLREVRAETRRLRESIAASEGQHVLTLEGIGPKYASRLNTLGIITLPQLMDAEPAEVARGIDATPEMVAEWQDMARLMQVRGIGPQFAEVLVRAGLRTVAELATADPERLSGRIEQLQAHRRVRLQGAEVHAGTCRRWIDAAKHHLEERVVRVREA